VLLEAVVHGPERVARGAELAAVREQPRLHGPVAAEEDAVPDVVLDVLLGELVPDEAWQRRCIRGYL